MATRRSVLFGVGAAVLAAGAGGVVWMRNAGRPDGAFAVSLSEEEWRERLTDAEYAVLRKGGTELAFSSPLHEEDRSGVYHCAGCDQPIYDAATKFHSPSGWPAFTAPLDDTVGTRPDPRVAGLTTEVYCARCGSHLGHVFDDGPPPTGKRHCINGVAMRFEAA